MSFKGIYFSGRPIIIPGAYADVDAVNMTPNRLSPANTIGAIGESLSGTPNKVVRTTNLRDAMSMLRGGNLFTAAQLMYTPSADVPGAGEVAFVRVAGSGVAQATYSISTQIVLTTADYGDLTNFYRSKVEAGTVTGIKFSLNQQDVDTNFVADNIGPIFTIQYVGTANYCRLSYTRSGTVLLIEISSDGANWSTLVTYDVSKTSVDTIGELITILDSNPALVATVHKYGDGNMTTSLLDAIVHQDIKTSAYTVVSQVGALLQYFKTNITTVVATAGASPTGTISTYNWTNFTGGSNGSSPSNQNWIDAIALLESETDVKLVYVATDAEAIHTAATMHCLQMSDVKVGRERIQIFGGAASETIDQVTTRAQDQGTGRALLVYPGIKRINILSGNLDTLAPFLTAASVCGMAAGVTPATPLTYKTLLAQGMEKYLKDSEVETLLTQGVCPIRFVKEDGIYQIVQSITTYQKDANVIFRKLSGMRLADFIKQEVRNTAKPFIGRIADAFAMLSIKNAVSSKLDLLTRGPQNPDGVLTSVIDVQSGTTGPAWDNLVVAFDGFDWVNISFRAHPVGEIAYITLFCTLEPAKMSV